MNSIRNIWLSIVGVLKEPSFDVGIVSHKVHIGGMSSLLFTLETRTFDFAHFKYL